jgi:mannitol/fructose-specific phosphotransferase system IIA component (Ntr-type)
VDCLRISAEVLKVNDHLHCVDFQLKKHLVKEVGKEDVEIDITIDSREKFIDFVHNTLIASKYIKDYVDASIDQA